MSLLSVRRFNPARTVVLALVVAVTTIVLAAKGWSFYRLSMDARVEHPDFQALRPSGTLGNGYGWVAALLMALNLMYLVRRKLATTRFGSMAAWLDVHVFTGLLVATLVSFHSTFQLRTPIATTSTVSLAMVVLTGFVGRFLHALAPRHTAAQLRALIDSIETELPDMRDDLTATIAKRPGPAVPADASFVRGLSAIPAWWRVGRARVRALEMLMPLPHTMSRRLNAAWHQLFKAAAADARADGVAALLRTWRALHRFFALLMIVAVMLHALVAWHYGYRWIFH